MRTLLAPFLFAVLAGCSVSSDPSSPPPKAPAGDDEGPANAKENENAATTYEPKAIPTACRFIVPKSVEGTVVKCVDVVVPENRAKKDGRTIKIHVAVFPGKKELPPTFELIGGPGGGADPTVAFLAAGDAKMVEEHRFLRERGDYVTFDQRGIGRSEPNLSCAENTTTGGSYVDIMTKCRDRLVGQGIDLGAYTTYDNALDVDDIRKALGYAKYDLHAISYGTLLALEVMRHRPDAVRSVIIDGVVPPEANLIGDTARTIDENLTRIFDACAAQAACKAAFPNLEGSLTKLAADLAAKPFKSYTYGSFDFFLFANLVGSSMYDPDGVKRIPLWIHEFATRGQAGFDDFEKEEEALYTAPTEEPPPLVREVVDAMGKLDPLSNQKFLGMNDGMHTSVTCSDSGQFESYDQAVAQLEKVRPAFKHLEALKEQFDVCAVWPKSEKRATTKQAVTSAIPTLSLGGEFDPVTPAYWAEQVTKTLSNSNYFLMKGLAHGSMDACSRDIKSDFFANPSATPDTACNDARTLTFVTKFGEQTFRRARSLRATSIAGIRPNVLVRPMR